MSVDGQAAHAPDDHAHDGHAHDGHAHGVSRATQRRALWIALAANGGFLVAEVVGGIAFTSLALLADAAHMASDVAGLGIALVAQRAARPAGHGPKHSYGLQRAEVLGAQANGLRPARRLRVDRVRGRPAARRRGRRRRRRACCVVATIGLAVNLASAVVLWPRAGVRASTCGARSSTWSPTPPARSAAIVAGVAVRAVGRGRGSTRRRRSSSPCWCCGRRGGCCATPCTCCSRAPPGASTRRHRGGPRRRASTSRRSTTSTCGTWPRTRRRCRPTSCSEGEIAARGPDAAATGSRRMLADASGITHATLELECHPCDPEPDERGRIG